MKRQIAVRVISVLMVLAFIGGGTYAYFNNSAVSTNNVFASGNLDLKLANGSASFTDNVTASFGGISLSPGACLPKAELKLKNTGTVPGNHIDITAANSNSSFAGFLRLESLQYDGGAVSLTDSNGNGFSDLQDLAAAGILNMPFTDFSGHSLEMTVCLDATAGNPQQGQSSTLDFSILLDQGPHS